MGLIELCESLFLRAQVPKLGTLVVCTNYRLPKSSTARFIDFMENSLKYLSHSKCVVMGDLNIDTQKYDEQLTNSLGFVNQITLPTYVNRTTGRIGSTIDHV